MPLLKCPDCGASVSTKANRCPHCGCPRENKTVLENDIRLVELTSKKYKIQKVYAILLFVLGFFMINVSVELGILIMIISFIWLILIKIAVWWNHK